MEVIGRRRLYYRRVEEGKQYPVLCRRLARANEDFISNKSPSAGFDFTSGKRIEQKLLDYNEEAENFGGLALLPLCFILISKWSGMYVEKFLYPTPI